VHDRDRRIVVLCKAKRSSAPLRGWRDLVLRLRISAASKRARALLERD